MNRLLPLLLPVLVAAAGPSAALAVEVPPPGSFANEAQRIRVFLADCILDGLDGRDWLVAGTLNEFAETLTTRAASRGIPLTLVDRAFPLLPEAAQEKVKALGQDAVGATCLTPFFFARHWMETAPDEALAHLALLESPEIWHSASFDFVPSQLLYLGVKGNGKTQKNPEDCLASAEEIWDAIGEFLLDSEAEASTPDAAQYRQMLRVHASRAANEFGVLLESAGRLDEALEAYSRSYRFYDGNLSALMNKASLVKRGNHAELQGEIVAELNRQNAQTIPDVLRWGLEPVCGPVLHPEDFVPMGWAWALSGVRIGDEKTFAAGLEGVREEFRDQVQKLLEPGRKRQVGTSDDAKKVFEALCDDKTRAAAALGLYREACQAGADERMLGHWRGIAEKAGTSSTDFCLADMAGCLAKRDVDGAKQILRKGLETDGANIPLWRNLANLQSTTGDREGLAKSLAGIQLLKEPPAGLLPFVQGLLFSMEGKTADARGEFLKSLEAWPGDAGVLDPLLRLDMQCADGAAAKSHAEILLQALPEHPFAHYILGSLAYADGQYEEAISHLQRSVAADPQAYAFNDYACALSAIGRYAEAAKAIEIALQQSPDNPSMLDTYAEALIGLEKWEEAEAAVRKALSQATDETQQSWCGALRLHEAKILLHKGETQNAKESLRKAEMHEASFGPMESKLQNELKSSLPAL